MNYNSQKETLIMPEYGRNVQMLVRTAQAEQDPEKKQKLVDCITQLMLHMNPAQKNLEEFKDKVWKHIFKIAEYKDLDIKTPKGDIPTPEDNTLRPDKLPYQDKLRTFRHYGFHLRTMIHKAAAMEEGETKEDFKLVIGSFMKMAYRNWHKAQYISDDIIKDDIAKMSENTLIIPPDMTLDYLINSVRIKPKSNHSYKNKGKKSKGKKGRKN